MTAKKTKFVATFANGDVITRTSAHDYTVAWRATWTDDDGSNHAATGFAASQAKASPIKPMQGWAHRGMSAVQRDAIKRETEAFHARSGYRVEFAKACAA